MEVLDTQMENKEGLKSMKMKEESRANRVAE